MDSDRVVSEYIKITCICICVCERAPSRVCLYVRAFTCVNVWIPFIRTFVSLYILSHSLSHSGFIRLVIATALSHARIRVTFTYPRGVRVFHSYSQPAENTFVTLFPYYEDRRIKENPMLYEQCLFTYKLFLWKTINYTMTMKHLNWDSKEQNIFWLMLNKSSNSRFIGG